MQRQLWCLPTSADPDPIETIAEHRRNGVPWGRNEPKLDGVAWFSPRASAISRDPEPLARRLLGQLAERTRAAGNARNEDHLTMKSGF